jgi:hypothetical protein
MSSTPGLARFNRVITTKRDGTCEFCQSATIQGRDFAAVNGAGRWLAVCAKCAASVGNQIAAIVQRIAAAVTDQSVLPDLPTEAIIAAMQGTATPRDAVATLALVTDVLAKLNQAPETPLITALRAMAVDPAAREGDRDMAISFVRYFDRNGRLSDKQEACAIRMTTPKGATPAAATIEQGLFVLGDPADWSSFWIARPSKAGHLYAMRLASAPVEGHALHWDFVKGGMRDLARARRATAEEAAALGHTTHFCCFCARELTDDGEGRSVEVGYGPVCARKNGLPWG